MAAGSGAGVVACRAGRGFAFDPTRTALIVIDMQHDFLSPGGMADRAGEPLAGVRAAIEPLQAVLAAARAAGLMVVHTREGYATDLSDLPASRQQPEGVGSAGPRGRALIRGEPGHDFVDELYPLPDELVIDKPGFGAFFRGDLEERLRALDIRHLVLTGVTTQCCVESTLREAVDRGFDCLLLEDCCAAYDPRMHQGTLATIQSEGHLFGWISDSPRFVEALQK